MTLRNVIRAWTDPTYRASLSEAERAQLPENPAGLIELSGTALDVVSGGKKSGGKKSGKGGKSGKSGGSSGSSKSSSSGGGGGLPV